MGENEIKILERRIHVFIKRIKTLFYDKEVPLQAAYCKYNPFVPFDQRLNGEYKTGKVGDSWGNDWEMAWFHIEGKIPAEWQGRCVAARINLGGESLLFADDGTPELALSCHTIWPGTDFSRDRITISNKAKGGEKIEFWMEVTAGELFGLQLNNDHGLSAPESFGSHKAEIQDLSVGIFRQDIWHLYLDFFVLNNLMKSLPMESVRRAKLRYVMNHAIDCFLGTDEHIVKKTQKIS